MKDKINISKRAQKDFKKIPKHIVKNFQRWALLVEDTGLIEVRKIKGFHDEPLTGNRSGQRSVRLSKAYRLFYVEMPDGEINIVNVLEVNKHEY
jgi:proteic killer suppression protein